MDQEEHDHHQSLLQIYTAHLRQLELMAAKYGGLAVPSHVTLEIEENRRKIAEIEGRLRAPTSAQPKGPRHNLPSRDYERYVGRQKELTDVYRLLGPHIRTVVVTIDGIGGIGKSALALETAYSFLDRYADLLVDERFEAIVWISAKQSYLTADGIRERRQGFRTLEEVFAAIARVLDYPVITRARAEEQHDIVDQVLREQRTLLILDNLETVDDENLLDFLRELPEPTKALVTTRHRIDVARTVRLTGMQYVDALTLIAQEAARKEVTLTDDEQEQFWLRTGGVPLAIVWSIGLMGLGGSVESVLRRLGSGQSDIARFCFEESVAQIRGRDAYWLLLALVLFDASVSRSMLGHVVGIGADEFGRDVGLEELLQLSIVNKDDDLFNLLPLTRVFVLEEFSRQQGLDYKMRERWARYLMELAIPYRGFHWLGRDRQLLLQAGRHFTTLVYWAQQAMRPEMLLGVLPALAYYYDLVGQWTELLYLGRLGIEFARLTGELETIIFINHYISWILSHQGRHQEAESCVIEALNLTQNLGDPTWRCSALQSYSQVLRRRGEFDLARETCYEEIELLDEVPNSHRAYVRADVEYELGKIERDAGNNQAARMHFLAARSVFKHDDEHPVFNIEFAWGLLSNLGLIAYREGDFEQAQHIYYQCLPAYREIGGKGDLATLLLRIATLEEQLCNGSKALAFAHEALEWARKLGMVQEWAEAEALLVRLDTAAGAM
jgi:tetratricopeptide (TPR) repeat protein